MFKIFLEGYVNNILWPSVVSQKNVTKVLDSPSTPLRVVSLSNHGSSPPGFSFDFVQDGGMFCRPNWLAIKEVILIKIRKIVFITSPISGNSRDENLKQ